MNSQNYYISNFYTPGYSSVSTSLYKTGLVFAFKPWVPKNNPLGGEYDSNQFLSVTIDYEKADALLHIARPIINGNDNCQLKLILPCNNDTSLTFEHKLQDNGQMRSYLSIDKNSSKITYLFNVSQYTERVNGQTITKTTHSGLSIFARALNSYLTHIGPDYYMNKLTGAEYGDPDAQFA